MGIVKYSGPMASFHCPTNAEIRSLKVHFSPKQEGTGDPSPENVRPIVGWDGVEVYINDSTINYEFGVLGKNKLNVDAEQQAPDNTNMLPENKRIFTPNTYCVGMSWSNYYIPNSVTSYSVSNGTIAVMNNNVYGLGYPVRVTPGQAYFLSATTTNGQAHLAYFAADGTYVSSVSTNTINKSFTVPSGVETAVIVFYSSSDEAIFSNVQLELGSTATAYEPYDPNHTVYGGWVDLISGEVVREWVLNTHTIAATDGTSGGAGTGGDTNYRFVAWNLASAHLPDSDKIKQAVCDIAPYSNQIGGSRFWLSGGTVYMVLPNDNNEYSAIVAYAERDLNNTTYHLAPTQLQTFLGQNNVWSNADYVEVEYDLHETQTLLQRKAFIMANQPHVIKPAAASLQNFKTDIIAPLKECKIYFSPVQEGSGNASPDNVRPINGWNSIQVGLPSEYQRVEWIESTGTQYIDTGVEGSSGLSVSMSVLFTSVSVAVQILFGTRYSSGNRFGVGIVGNTHWDLAMNGDHSYSAIINPGTIYTVDFSSDNNMADLKVDGNSIGTTTETVSGQLNCWIFDWNYNNSSQWPAYIKMYSCEMRINGNVLRNFIPCYRKSDNKPGMYDTVSRNFYTNAGTGEFICGPDVQEQSLLIDWTTEAGTVYGGYVDLVKGELVQEYYKIILDGTSDNCKVNRDYSDNSYIVGGVVWLNPYGAADKTSGISNLYCDKLQIVVVNASYSQKLPYIRTVGNGHQYLRIYLANAENYPNLDTEQKRIDFVNAYLQEKPLTVIYPLTEPIHYTLTSTQLKTLRGINNIWSNANGDIELAYWSH